MRKTLNWLLAASLFHAAIPAIGQTNKPTDSSSAAPDQVLGHHLVRSAQLEQNQTDDGRVRLMPWRERDDVVEGWDWSLPPGVEPVSRSGLIFKQGEKRRFPGNKLTDACFVRQG